MIDLSKIKFMTFLAIVSILGFGAILTNAVTGIDIGAFVDSLLFIIIGIALMLAGGIKLFFKYFENGLTNREISNIVTVVVGSTSVVTGILTAPFFNFNLTVLDGFKAIVSLVAIIAITLEAYKN